MSTVEAVKLYEVGRRGRPVPGIRAGDLHDPSGYGKSPWQSLTSLLAAIVDIARETRELQARMITQSFRRGES